MCWGRPLVFTSFRTYPSMTALLRSHQSVVQWPTGMPSDSKIEATQPFSPPMISPKCRPKQPTKASQEITVFGVDRGGTPQSWACSSQSHFLDIFMSEYGTNNCQLTATAEPLAIRSIHQSMYMQRGEPVPSTSHQPPAMYNRGAVSLQY